MAPLRPPNPNGSVSPIFPPPDDDDFERFDEFDSEIVLSPDEFSELNRFLTN